MTVDAFAPRLSFFWNAGMNYLHGGRQAAGRPRLLWAKLMREQLRAQGRALARRCAPTPRPAAGPWRPQDVFNNVARTTIEAMAAVAGQTQSLHTNSLDEALALPTDFSARIARNTQLFLQIESGPTRVIDPWGGSFYRRAPDPRPRRPRARPHRGGRGRWAAWPRRSSRACPSCASRRPPPGPRPGSTAAGRASSGVNRYLPRRRRRDPDAQGRQCRGAAPPDRKLRELKAERDPAGGRARALEALEAGARGKANLLDLSVEAARANATVGEISLALEQVFGRHRGPAGGGARASTPPRPARAQLARAGPGRRLRGGRRPRPGHPGRQDGPGRPRPRPEGDRHRLRRPRLRRRGRPALRHPGRDRARGGAPGVHVVGASSLAAGHLTLVPELKAELEKLGRGDIMIVVGGVIPPADFPSCARPAPADLPAGHGGRRGGQRHRRGVE